MPDIDAETNALIGLYERTKRFNALPFPGSLLEQPEWILRIFDLIESTKLKVAAAKEEEANNDLEKARLQKCLT